MPINYNSVEESEEQEGSGKAQKNDLLHYENASFRYLHHGCLNHGKDADLFPSHGMLVCKFDLTDHLLNVCLEQQI